MTFIFWLLIAKSTVQGLTDTLLVGITLVKESML
jgi:hypothetical protein